MTQYADWLPWIAPALFLAAALLSLARTAAAWPILTFSTRAALLAATANCVIQFDSGHAAAPLVGLLIAFLGWIIGDYSRRYLRGEPGQARFVAAYLGTLASAATVVASNHLGVLIAAWAASSTLLHQLLTFYRDRPAAVLVAHKKFLTSRLAEACLVLAAVLIYREWGTVDLLQIGASAAASPDLGWGTGAAAGLIAVAAVLKCAQLPLHGWLIQVMEAPTPVSALLHAGVVNLAGYVLIRLAPFINASTTARSLLVVFGSVTAVLAGLVMLTRVSIKVRLAWSTCSQMGLMLLECGLGLYDLALLHLLAHSLYKAHAFLTSGEAVREGLLRKLQDRPGTPPSRWSALLALALTGGLVAAASGAWQALFGTGIPSALALTLLSFGLAMRLWPSMRQGRGGIAATSLVVAATLLYLAWHWLLAEQAGLPHYAPQPVLAAWTLGLFAALYLLQTGILEGRATAFLQSLHDRAYAGFHLDEAFTRITYRIWPPRATQSSPSSSGES